MALHPRSDCLSKELVRLRSDTSMYPFRIVTNLHDFNSTEAYVTNVVQSPVQCGPGQIAPFLHNVSLPFFAIQFSRNTY